MATFKIVISQTRDGKTILICNGEFECEPSDSEYIDDWIRVAELNVAIEEVK